MSSEQFYSSLKATTGFSNVTDLSLYTALPDDWSVVLSDIVDSTAAINKGEYRAVNICGVAVITAINNVLKPLTFPYIFGGDGASLCIPNSVIPLVTDALLATRQLARTQFKLDLRIGIIPIHTIREAGHEVMVCKHSVSKHYQQAAFAGQGLLYAESIIKQDPRLQLQQTGTNSQVDLSGLECRWKEVPTQHEEILSLIVMAHSSDIQTRHHIYKQSIQAISDIYGDKEKSCPIYQNGLKIALKNRDLQYESKLKQGRSLMQRLKYYVQVRIYNIAGAYLMKRNVIKENVHWGNYKKDLVSNTDTQKFDGALRLVLSGTQAQRKRLVDFLEQQKHDHACNYGIHISDSALITCLLIKREGEHFHFVDGANGGYAMAVKMLKQN